MPVPVPVLVPLAAAVLVRLAGRALVPRAGLASAPAAGLPEARATMVSCWPRRPAAGGCRPVRAVKGVPGAGERRRTTAPMTSRRAAATAETGQQTATLETGRPAATSPHPMRSVVTGRSAVCGPSPRGPDPAEPAADVRRPRPMEVVRHPEAAVVVRRRPKAAVRRLRPTAVARWLGRKVAARQQPPKVADWWPAPMAVGQCSGPRMTGWPTVHWTSGPTVDFRLLRLATGRPMAPGGRGSSRVRDGVRRLPTGNSRCSPTWACGPSSSG